MQRGPPHKRVDMSTPSVEREQQNVRCGAAEKEDYIMVVVHRFIAGWQNPFFTNTPSALSIIPQYNKSRYEDMAFELKRMRQKTRAE
jgi:hypothetical protein